MNSYISSGVFGAPSTGVYRTKDGRGYFKFKLIKRLRYFEIRCINHPPLNGRDSDVNKTHLWPGGKVCFVKGREPRTGPDAIHRATEWAEYFHEYIRTGTHRS